MGTNYYSYESCSACNSSKELHIGKESTYCKFFLHIIPEQDLPDWDTWKKYLLKENVYILDEYDEVVDKEEFLDKTNHSAHIYLNEEFC